MLVNRKLKLLFIHIPKNSGTEMSIQIMNTYPDSQILNTVDYDTGIDRMHLYNDVIHKYINPFALGPEYLKFCIVRNPYNKLYSAWKAINTLYGYVDINRFIEEILTEEFIYGLELEEGDARVHYRPQHTFILDNRQESTVDYILKYENLNEDIEKFNRVNNLAIPLYANKNISKSYVNKFNLDSIAKINELYKRDFEILGYEMINTTA